MNSVRERLLEVIKILPEEKLHVLLEFANRLLDNYQTGVDEDELLMT
ncbi:MAG: hypothetical protein QHH75_12920 [Bacillota bacterium]|nr:hypothetical protein [Bacillota bacterium]